MSPEKIAAFIGVLIPAIWLAGLAWSGDLGARPVQSAIEFSGTWTIRLLFLALAITPFRRIAARSPLLLARRTLGVAAFGYGVLHLALYALDQQFDLAKIATEIVLRIYLTIGAVALLALAALAATSTDAAVRRLGPNWNRLHSLAYPAAVLGVVHFLLQAKADTDEPMLMIGLLAWLLGFRLLQRRFGVTPLRLVALAVAAALFAGGTEVGWYAFATAIDPWRIFAAQFDITFGPRPAAWVLIAGLTAALLAAIRQTPQRRTARSSMSSASSGALRGQSPS